MKAKPNKGKRKNLLKQLKSKAAVTHKSYHQFTGWLLRTFGKDLIQTKTMTVGDRKIKYLDYNEWELSKRLTGYDVMEKINTYIHRYCPEIKIVPCDDVIHSGSYIILIPHPTHGITVMFIPQLTQIQNQFFLYDNHRNRLIEELKKMSYVDKGSLDDRLKKKLKKLKK